MVRFGPRCASPPTSSLPVEGNVGITLVADREQALHEATWATARAIELDGKDAYGYALRGLEVLNCGPSRDWRIAHAIRHSYASPRGSKSRQPQKHSGDRAAPGRHRIR